MELVLFARGINTLLLETSTHSANHVLLVVIPASTPAIIAKRVTLLTTLVTGFAILAQGTR